jgi:hypothetical protein
MVPKIVAKGTSFKGAAGYLLHDKGSTSTAQRVAWSETRNLLTGDPGKAWRIMAATALDQDRLKAQAGIKASGRRSVQSVLHLVLSWHPEEADALTRDEIRRCAIGAIEALGAEDRQALLIAHNDEPQPHVHVLINRVSPNDGRMLSSSKDQLKLSKWAQAYESERGKIYCEERVLNNSRRDAKEYVRAPKSRPRPVVEAERTAEAANDNRYFADVKAAERTKDLALSAKARALAAQHREQWQALEARRRAERRQLAQERREALAHARAKVCEAYRDDWRTLYREQRQERATFESLEDTFFGRIKNRINALSLSQHIRGETTERVIARGFSILASRGARLEALDRAHRTQRAKLQSTQDAEVARGQAGVRATYQEKAKTARTGFTAERATLVMAQALEKDALKKEWHNRTLEREKVWDRFQEFARARRKTQADFGQAAAQKSLDEGQRASLLARAARAALRGPDRAQSQDKQRDQGKEKGD